MRVPETPWRYSRRRQHQTENRMTDSTPASLNADALPEDAPFIASTTRWLERAVIGLNLCPFARAPHVQGNPRTMAIPSRSQDCARAAAPFASGLSPRRHAPRQ